MGGQTCIRQSRSAPVVWRCWRPSGSVGRLLGINVFPTDEAPYHRKDMWISTAFCSLVAFLYLGLSLALIRENQKMEKAGLIEAPGQEVVDAPADPSSKGEKKISRYVC
jgi:hypothetical protein